MKKMFLLAAFALFIIATLLVGADAAGVNYVGHDKVVAALSKGGSLVSTPEFAVSGSYRNKGGQVVFEGTPAQIVEAKDSLTGEYLML